MAALMSRSLRDWSVEARSSGLSMPQVGVLMHLYRRQGCGVSGIGGHLGISSPAASQLVERLVQQGLVERREDPNDRRARELYLTERGRAMVEESIAARLRWIDDVAARLGPRDRRLVAAALPPLIAATQGDADARVPSRRRKTAC